MSRNDSWCVTVAIQDGGEKMIGWESGMVIPDYFGGDWEIWKYDDRWQLTGLWTLGEHDE